METAAEAYDRLVLESFGICVLAFMVIVALHLAGLHVCLREFQRRFHIRDAATLPPLQNAYRHVLARDPGLKVHLYGKEPRPGRKLGHVTVVGDDLDSLLARAHHAADYLMGVIDE